MPNNKISLYLLSFYLGIIAISDLGVKYYLKNQARISTSIFTKILLIFKISNLIKPLYGLLIDFVPIIGYKKKFYLYICFYTNILSWFIFMYQKDKNFYISIICLLIINISISFISVIASAIQVGISKMQDKKNKISKGTLSLMAYFFIIKAIGTLIPSYLKGVLIEKYTYNIIFYLSTFFSILILISGLYFGEDKIIKNKKPKIKNSGLIGQQKNEKNPKIKDKILQLINNKKILILFLLESSPSCVSPLFFYETNILGLNPKKLGLIDFISQISVIVFLNFYNYFLYNCNFRLIIFLSRILIFFNYSLIYMLIKKITQKYISDFVLLAFASSLNAGYNTAFQALILYQKQ